MIPTPPTSNKLSTLSLGAYGGLDTSQFMVFLALDRLPTLFDFDAISDVAYQPNVNLTLTHWQPTYGNWLIGVWGNSSYYFTLSATTPVGCPNHCNNHGNCQADGSCSCHANYIHMDCSLCTGAITSSSIQPLKY